MTREPLSRVGWPTHALQEVLERTRTVRHGLERVCVSMVTHPRAFQDCLDVAERVRMGTGLPVSVLLAPPSIPGRPGLEKLRAVGVDKVSVAVDAATPALFERHRGVGVRGQLEWDGYWRMLEGSVAVFGRGNAGVHLIVGLGETEREMVGTIQRAHDLGAATHLFSFFPEEGSALADTPQPALGSYAPFYAAISDIAGSGMRVLAHTGLLDVETARQLRDAGVSQVLLDVIGDDDTIRQVYHLERSSEDYLRSLQNARAAGLSLAPHIVLGLNAGEILGEYRALAFATSVGVDALVVVVLQPLSETPFAGCQPPSADDVGRFIAVARLLNPHTPIALGCARPAGAAGLDIETAALKAGASAIAFPHRSII